MMDFTLAETQQAVADLAVQVLAGADPWKELAQAGLLQLGVPETTVLLTEMGRHASADSVKALATLMTGALPVARWGNADLQRELLPAIASGELTLTAAIREPSNPAPPIPATTITDGKITGTKIGVLAGKVHFAIGYTEPEAGTDLAALRTRAVRDGAEYVVDGQKIFTTGAHEADYIWLACRTGPPRHKGISILIVDTADPGFSWTPIITLDGTHHVNATYYSGVRVPDRMRVGAENQGWRLITTQLNHERVMLGPAGRIAALHDRVRAWAAERSSTRPAGAPGRLILP